MTSLITLPGVGEITTIVEGRCFLEGPRWRDGALYVSDMRADEVLRITLDGTIDVIASVDDPCGLGWLPDGRMLVNSMAPRKIMRLEADGSVVEHADCTQLAPYPINDMVTDRVGRAYVGHWGYDVFGGVDPVAVPLLRVDPDGGVSEAGGEILLANGITLTADGRTLIVVETLGRRLTAFDVADDGSISGSRLWAALDATRPGRHLHRRRGRRVARGLRRRPFRAHRRRR